ncbi:MAG: RNA polymerase sigma factor [Gemmatimonadales bacterium]
MAVARLNEPRGATSFRGTNVSADAATDPELVAAWRGGDEFAAAELVRRHASPLGRYLAACGAGTDEVDDLVQDCFFKAFRGLSGWRGDGSFRGWLFRIGGNLVKDGFRRRKGRVFVAIEDHEVVDRADPDGELAADEAASRLAEGLRHLPRLQREVFLLRVQQGMSYEAIAAALDSTPGAARVHYHHAVKRLKGWLG